MRSLLLATLAAALLPRAVTFDEAKKDASKRQAYLAQSLDKLVAEGLIKGWFYQPDAEQAKKAKEAVRQVYKADGREFYFEKEYPNVLAPIESAAMRALPYYSEEYVAGSGGKGGLLIVGDVFALAGEDEVKSVLEDYALTVIKIRELGLKVKDAEGEERELDANVPALKTISHLSLIRLWGQLAQVENLLKGTRRVSDDFRKEAVKQYLASYRLFSTQFLKEKKIYDDNNENTLQKEIVDFLDVVLKTIQARVAGAGYQHKLVDKATQEHALEKK
jgi:hypothetical protein